MTGIFQKISSAKGWGMALLSWFLIAPVAAQTILNTEKLHYNKQKPFHFGLEASGELAQGNTSLLSINTMLTTGYRWEKHWIRLLGGNRLLAEPAGAIINNVFGQVRYNYLISHRYRTFHFYQLQSNHALILKKRQVAGSGLRMAVFQDDTVTLDFGAGLMYEQERLDPERLQPGESHSANVFRMANLVVFKYRLRENVSLLHTGYIQPDITKFRDIRILNELDLLFHITGHLTFNIAVEWRYDSDPPAILAHHDLNINTGLILNY